MAGRPLPTQAQTVIVGGGSIGCNIARELTRLGHRDVVILEQNQLTAGTTWHAAGLMATADIFDEASIEIYKHSLETIYGLEAETGMATGLKQCGYVSLAPDSGWQHHMRRVTAFQRMHGIDVNEISPAEVQEMFPLADVSDLLGAFHFPNDGRINPVDLTMAIARSARNGGAQIFEGQRVTEIIVENRTATGVRLATGESIAAENVVIAGGLWSRELAATAGVNLPVQATEHYYLITDNLDGMSPDTPVLDDPSVCSYYREEGGGLMIGLFEPDDAAAWNLHKTPHDFAFGEIEPDWDRMMPHLERSYARVPSAIDAGVRKFFCGPESFTPDLAPLVGETAEIRKLWTASGLNSGGILNGPGIGMVLANWIVDGVPPVDASHIDVRRFSGAVTTPKFRRDRITEVMGFLYGTKYPSKGFETGRGGKRSVLYDRLKDNGAFFSEYHGWETPMWYAPDPSKAKIDEFTWGRENWWPYLEGEALAARNDVVLMDMSDMSKFQIEGPDALALVNRVSANDVDVENGRIVYTCWTNDKGGILVDLTVTRLADDKFYVVTAESWRGQVEAILRNALAEGEVAVISNTTSGMCQLNLHGPKARDLMQKLTFADMTNSVFPFGTSKLIDLGYAQVLAMRVTYVGELGWELHIPAENACHVFDLIMDEGKEFGLRLAGIQALFSLRIEKAYREYGHDMDNTDTPYNAGLGFTVKLDKPDGFVGKDALAEYKAKGLPNRRLVQFLLEDPEPLIFGGEPIYMDNKIVGYVTSGAYGFTLGASVGLGYVELGDAPLTKAEIEAGTFQIDVAGQRFSARPSLAAMYDPKLERVKS